VNTKVHFTSSLQERLLRYTKKYVLSITQKICTDIYTSMHQLWRYWILRTQFYVHFTSRITFKGNVISLVKWPEALSVQDGTLSMSIFYASGGLTYISHQLNFKYFRQDYMSTSARFLLLSVLIFVRQNQKKYHSQIQVDIGKAFLPQCTASQSCNALT
jgi:hypothetical protein